MEEEGSLRMGEGEDVVVAHLQVQLRQPGEVHISRMPSARQYKWSTTTRETPYWRAGVGIATAWRSLCCGFAHNTPACGIVQWRAISRKAGDLVGCNLVGCNLILGAKAMIMADHSGDNESLAVFKQDRKQKILWDCGLVRPHVFNGPNVITVPGAVVVQNQGDEGSD